MKKCIIKYRYFNNSDRELEVKKILASVIRFLPEWLKSLSVARTSPQDSEAALAVTIDKEYRQASILVSEGFFQEDKCHMRRMMLHEILHIHHNEIDCLLLTLIGYVEKRNKDLSERFREDGRMKVESFIQDMSYILEELLKETENEAKTPGCI